MRPVNRPSLLLVFLAYGAITPGSRAGDESDGDLHPLPPLTRAVFGNNRRFRLYGNHSPPAVCWRSPRSSGSNCGTRPTATKSAYSPWHRTLIVTAQRFL